MAVAATEMAQVRPGVSDEGKTAGHGIPLQAMLGCKCGRCVRSLAAWRQWCARRDRSVPIQPLLDAIERRADRGSCDVCAGGGAPHRHVRWAAARYADRFGSSARSTERQLWRLAARGWTTIEDADEWCVAIGVHLVELYPWVYR